MAMPSQYVKFTLVLASEQKTSFYNVFYFKPTAPPVSSGSLMGDSADLGLQISALLTNHLVPVLTTDSTIVGYNTEYHVAGQTYDTAGLIGSPGSVSGDELADFEAVCIQKRTAIAGKSGRGRWFLGPVPESFTDENYVTGAAQLLYDPVQGDWGATVTALTVDWEPQLYSKKLATLTAITSLFCNPKIASIGGRKSHSIL